MQELELFIKGLVKTFEEFYSNMVQVGRSDSLTKPVVEHRKTSAERTQKSSQPKKVGQKEFAELEEKVMAALANFPKGCTLKELAGSLAVQWHFLRIPIRRLIAQDKILKNDKIYSLKGPVSETIPVVERPATRRRVVDAKVLDTPIPEKPPVDMPEMSVREKEILKFKTLTAFRGRPEGLTVAELAAVLGRNPAGLEIILKELIADKKVIEGKGSKFHLS